MRALRGFMLILMFVGGLAPMLAQRQQRQTLTEPQVEAIREAGIDPDLRVKLYTKFIDEDVDGIKALASRTRSAARARRMDDELEALADLMDELGSNLDQYGGRKADMRKSLKPLTEATQRWLEVLHSIPTEPGFDVALKDAIGSRQDLADQANQLLSEQTEYFKLHKDQSGQDRVEPN
ncbi:MAG TPA: hypothetical protein VGS41_00710 [Chthonomonadales bacterium]|nr:hypothetical protein [Chthonomonadales bacterium]